MLVLVHLSSSLQSVSLPVAQSLWQAVTNDGLVEERRKGSVNTSSDSSLPAVFRAVCVFRAHLISSPAVPALSIDPVRKGLAKEKLRKLPPKLSTLACQLVRSLEPFCLTNKALVALSLSDRHCLAGSVSLRQKACPSLCVPLSVCRHLCHVAPSITLFVHVVPVRSPVYSHNLKPIFKRPLFCYLFFIFFL